MLQHIDDGNSHETTKHKCQKRKEMETNQMIEISLSFTNVRFACIDIIFRNCCFGNLVQRSLNHA